MTRNKKMKIRPIAENQNIIKLKWSCYIFLARTASVASLKATKSITPIPTIRMKLFV